MVKTIIHDHQNLFSLICNESIWCHESQDFLGIFFQSYFYHFQIPVRHAGTGVVHVVEQAGIGDPVLILTE